MTRALLMARLTFWALGTAAVALSGCGENAEQRRARATEILTSRAVGLAYLEEGKLAEAEAEFLKLIDLAPREPLGFADLGLVYLRMGRYEDAERRVREALERTPDDPDVRLILAKIYELTDRQSEAIAQLEETLQSHPDHVTTRHALVELLIDSEDPDDLRRAADNQAVVVRAVPANIAARLDLLEALIRTGQPDSAAAQLEQLRQRIPDMPSEAAPFFDRALALLRNGQTDEALRPAITFHNFLKATSLYQSDVIELRGPGGAMIGFPVIRFHQDLSLQTPDEATVLASIRFADVTDTVGLNLVRGDPTETATHAAVTAADYDGDEDVDLFVIITRRSQPSASVGHLLRNELGTFVDVTAAAGISPITGATNATFADYDNDGRLDLYLVRAGANVLYRNTDDSTFSDVTAAAGVADQGAGRAATFLDIDHDGDLDIYVANEGPNRLYRNNADGTFTERADAMGIAGGSATSIDVAFGDFDDDGDIDLLVVNEDSRNILYTNLRGSRFDDVTESAGLSADRSSAAAAVADYDNDGFLDVFVAGRAASGHAFYRNRTDGTFERDTRPGALLDRLASLPIVSADFLDFDNDGFQDLLLLTDATDNVPKRPVLLRNSGPGRFTDFGRALPEPLPATPLGAAPLDFGNDGDLDIALAGADAAVRLWRNDGGNVNHYLTLKLVGLTSGSGKNNYYGIGAKLEIRAGDLYQSRVVTQPTTHIGLGPRVKADVVRIVWTNGVPQNIFFPGGDQDLLEQQILKGSCAFLYTWDGEQFTFVKDIMWKSAIGMPTGIMGGLRSYAPPDASKEYLKIPGDLLRPRDGTYTIQVTEELWEVAYIDEIALLAVDHPDSVEIYVDEKFVPPGPAQLRLYQVADKHYPVAAWDDRGNDLLARILEKDDVYVDNLRPGRFQGLTDVHDLVLDLGDVAPHDSLFLFLQGWVFPTDASINVAMAQSAAHRTVFPSLHVPDPAGGWRTVIENMSFPSGKDKTVVVDLTGLFPTDDYRVRIRTNMEIYWDHAFFSQPQASAPVNVTTLQPVAADLHYRGYSRLYRKGGRHGPHWFDYNDVSEESPWLPMTGAFTRYGDVRPLLVASDDMYVIVPAGDEITVSFSAADAPTVPTGWTRDFLIYSDGWIKDGDLNTATGQTVEPLPFHDMSQYPYGDDEAYPNDRMHQDYVERYNVRRVEARER